MHFIIGIITAVMVLFPASDSGGKSLYQLWMDAYEKYLYQQMAENFEREEREQKASEEIGEGNDLCTDVCESTTQSGAELPTGRADEEPTTVAATEAVSLHEATQVGQATPLYSVDGYIPDENLQAYLYQSLSEHGIGYFMPYAVCLIAQESTWNPMAENKNGRDKGLLQFRVEYVPWMDWTDPYQQIDYFIQQMANRAAAGCTVSDMISRHMMSDYGGYNQDYVDAVLQHANTLVQIR